MCSNHVWTIVKEMQIKLWQKKFERNVPVIKSNENTSCGPTVGENKLYLIQKGNGIINTDNNELKY